MAIENAQLYADNLRAERMSAIGQTIAGLSHYTKNILAGLQGGVELVNLGFKKKNEETLTEGWQMVERNIGRVSELVLDMLNYSREKGPSLHPTDINQTISDVVRLFSERIIERKVSLDLCLNKKINPIMLDPSGMERIILNLISNSLDALPEENGRIIVQTSLYKKRVSIKVGDNGCGIPPDKVKKIFDFFMSTKGSKGTGIGLAVVQKIVKEHKGRIKVESKVGKGTTFTISLPYRAH